MLMTWLLAALGLVILLLAGDALVKGAVNLSLRLGVPALIVGLVIVGFGTSSPELLVSIGAVLEGKPGLAMGNVVGSNIANILLVLGLPAVISGLNTSQCDSRKSYLQMMVATVVFIGLAMRGTFDWISALVLLSLLVYMLFDATRDAHQHRKDTKAAAEGAEAEEIEGADPDLPWWKIFFFLALGMIGLPLGADLLVTNASKIASAFGVSEAVIGLTLVALGTSLPELATTVASAIRRQADVALGNVIGSNMFNLLAIIGVTSLIGEVPVAQEFLTFDLWVMLGASLLLWPVVMWRKNIGRIAGLVLCLLYVVYIAATLI